jgi:O-antigen/teichoic acid export membrane protein
MSFKRNILANYASQLYVTAVGIMMVPLYVQYMGAEAYGLVGFYAMLQVWFGLLDVGLTPTMARESARFQGGASTALEYRRLTRALEGVFFGVALLGCILLFAMASPMASGWLQASELPIDEITQSLQLIAFIVALRWMSGLYRGVITGAEKLVWLSGFNSLVASGRFVLVLPLLMFVSATPFAFFAFQLAMAIFEFLGLAWMAYRLLPPVEHGQRIQWEWAPLKPVLKFSLSIAFTSSVWVLVTQTDKLILSKILPLADYGYFTVAVLLASGILIACSPISGALLPRLTRLQAEGLELELIDAYRSATRWTVIAISPISLILIFYPTEVLWVWTGNSILAMESAHTLKFYALGNALLSLSSFAYFIQYAKGNLKLHMVGNLLFLIIIIPTLIWMTNYYGVAGAGWVWAAMNFLYILLWTPVVHNKFIPMVHTKWLTRDILMTVFPSIMFALITKNYLIMPDGRFQQAVTLIFIAIIITTMCIAGAYKHTSIELPSKSNKF